MLTSFKALPFGVFLLLSPTFTCGASPSPQLPPSFPKLPGKNVLIVIKNGSDQETDGSSDAPVSIPNPTISSSGTQMIQVNGYGAAERKSFLIPFSGIKRQGQLLSKHITDTGADENSPKVKKDKSHRLVKLLPSSPRYLSGGPVDLFRKTLGFGKTQPTVLNQKRGSFADFRPHQPDITAELQSGKLSLPVGFTNLNILKDTFPTPMANKINPYTNGVAASFPPGIDPYEGFIRYAVENLDTPLTNIVDYHSLEQYYGTQHPLSPHNGHNHFNKEHDLGTNSYAENFAYNTHTSNGGDVDSAPPLIQGRPKVPHGRFHQTNNGPEGENGHHVGHGPDEFHAPSPGLSAAPPRPRPHSSTDISSYEHEEARRTPPYDPPPPGFGEHFAHNSHQVPPFNKPTNLNKPGGDHPEHAPFPPDLNVFEEGPPPPSYHHPIPPPPDAPPPQAGHPEQHQTNNAIDAGDDSIWGILDLAEMLEKGFLNGHTDDDGSKPQHSNSPHPNNKQGGNRGPSAGNPHERVVVPVYTRPPPPVAHSDEAAGIPYPPSGNSPYDGSPAPPIPPGAHGHQRQHFDESGSSNPVGHHSNNPHYSHSSSTDDGYDYNDQPGLGDPSKHPILPYGALDSHENNDYSDYK